MFSRYNIICHHHHHHYHQFSVCTSFYSWQTREQEEVEDDERIKFEIHYTQAERETKIEIKFVTQEMPLLYHLLRYPYCDCRQGNTTSIASSSSSAFFNLLLLLLPCCTFPFKKIGITDKLTHTHTHSFPYCATIQYFSKSLV